MLNTPVFIIFFPQVTQSGGGRDL